MAYHVNSLTALGAQTYPTSAISIQATFSQIYLHNHILSQFPERDFYKSILRDPQSYSSNSILHIEPNKKKVGAI